MGISNDVSMTPQRDELPHTYPCINIVSYTCLLSFFLDEQQTIAYHTINQRKSQSNQENRLNPHQHTSFQRQVVTRDCTPDSGVVSSLFGSDSHATLPSDPLRMNLYWNVVFGGK